MIRTLVSTADAIAAATAAAWSDETNDRTVIHSMVGLIGADWDLTAALDQIRAADELLWADDVFGHELLVRYTDTSGRKRTVRFDVRKPATPANDQETL